MDKSPTAEVIRITATHLLTELAFKDAANRIGNALLIDGGVPKAVYMIEEFLIVNTKSYLQLNRGIVLANNY